MESLCVVELGGDVKGYDACLAGSIRGSLDEGENFWDLLRRLQTYFTIAWWLLVGGAYAGQGLGRAGLMQEAQSET